MNRIGEVVEINGETVHVKLIRHSACGKCKACKFGEDDSSVYADAFNPLEAGVGDHVEISIEESNLLSAAAILYVFPLVTLLISVMAVNWILKASGAEARTWVLGLTALFSLAVPMMIIRMNNGRFKASKKYMPVVTRIIEKG